MPPNDAPPRIASGAALLLVIRGPLAQLHQPCSPPSSQMIRMIGIGIPISHKSKPRPMGVLLVSVSASKRRAAGKVPGGGNRRATPSSGALDERGPPHGGPPPKGVSRVVFMEVHEGKRTTT